MRSRPARPLDLPTAARHTYATRKGAHTNRPQWSRKEARRLGARLSERLARGATWDDLAIPADGLTLEAKGRGHVLGNSRGYVKLSALGLAASAKGFEERFGRPPTTRQAARPTAWRPPTRRPWWTVDEMDIVRAMSGVGLRSLTQRSARVGHHLAPPAPDLQRMGIASGSAIAPLDFSTGIRDASNSPVTYGS